MGQEVKCAARVGGKKEQGRLQLESETLLFRSPGMRLHVPFGEITKAVSEGGTLIVRTKQGTHEFDVGSVADRWVQRITNPKTLVEKLGVKNGQDVIHIGKADEGLLAELKAAKAKVRTRLGGGNHDWIFLGMEGPADLDRIKGLDSQIKPDGGVWIVFPKGRTDLKDIHVIAAGKSAGLVDNKVARISDRLTALKFVIPVSRRK